MELGGQLLSIGGPTNRLRESKCGTIPFCAWFMTSRLFLCFIITCFSFYSLEILRLQECYGPGNRPIPPPPRYTTKCIKVSDYRGPLRSGIQQGTRAPKAPLCIEGSKRFVAELVQSPMRFVQSQSLVYYYVKEADARIHVEFVVIVLNVNNFGLRWNFSQISKF